MLFSIRDIQHAYNMKLYSVLNDDDDVVVVISYTYIFS